MFESQLQKGHILYLTTGISQDWSDLVFRGLFVPLVNRAVSYLAGTTSVENADFVIGNDFSYSSEELTSTVELVIRKPDESKVKIKKYSRVKL